MRNQVHEDNELTFHDVKVAAFNGVAQSLGFKDTGALLRRAFSFKAPESAGPGFVNGARTVGRWIGEIAKNQVLGDPYTAYREIRGLSRMAGGLPGGLAAYMKGYHWRKPNNITGWLANGVNAYSVGSNLYDAATTEDPNTRKGNLAVAASQIATMPFTGRLGLPGLVMQQGIESGIRHLVEDKPKGVLPFSPRGYQPWTDTNLNWRRNPDAK